VSAGMKQKTTKDGKKEKQGRKASETTLAGAPIYGDLDLAKSRQQSHEQREQQ
jgi:hypothetical protein